MKPARAEASYRKLLNIPEPTVRIHSWISSSLSFSFKLRSISRNYVIKFQNVSNLYPPPGNDIFQMLNGIITCFLKIPIYEISCFKNDSIFFSRRRRKFSRKIMQRLTWDDVLISSVNIRKQKDGNFLLMQMKASSRNVWWFISAADTLLEGL